MKIEYCNMNEGVYQLAPLASVPASSLLLLPPLLDAPRTEPVTREAQHQPLQISVSTQEAQSLSPSETAPEERPTDTVYSSPTGKKLSKWLYLAQLF